MRRGEDVFIVMMSEARTHLMHRDSGKQQDDRQNYLVAPGLAVPPEVLTALDEHSTEVLAEIRL